MWLTLLALACTAPLEDTAVPQEGPDAPPEDVEPEVEEDSDAPSEDPDDEARARALVAGQVSDTRQALLEIAWSGGWPVQTAAGTWLFVSETPAALAGDHSNWQPEPLTEGDGVWWIEVDIPAPEGAGYKVVRGDAWEADPWARSYTWDAHGELSYVAAPTDTWRLDRWPGLEGQGLAPRTVRVYVPPGTGPWPTLYAQDGQNLFSPQAFYGGWRLQEALAGLGAAALVVAVDNTPDRMDEYTHVEDALSGQVVGGQGAAYADLLQLDLRPQIEQTYGPPAQVGVLGSSLGGLISLYVAHRYPTEFDWAISLSGTLGWGRFAASNTALEELYEQAGVEAPILYVDSGGSDGGDGCDDVDGDGLPEDDPNDSDNFCTNRHFADGMADLGYTWGTNLHHWHEPGAPHNEAAWADRVHRPLALFLGL